MTPRSVLVRAVDLACHGLNTALDWCWERADRKVCSLGNKISEEDRDG